MTKSFDPDVGNGDSLTYYIICRSENDPKMDLNLSSIQQLTFSEPSPVAITNVSHFFDSTSINPFPAENFSNLIKRMEKV